MPENQYHEPPEELSEKTRTFARMVTSLVADLGEKAEQAEDDA